MIITAIVRVEDHEHHRNRERLRAREGNRRIDSSLRVHAWMRAFLAPSPPPLLASFWRRVRACMHVRKRTQGFVRTLLLFLWLERVHALIVPWLERAHALIVPMARKGARSYCSYG